MTCGIWALSHASSSWPSRWLPDCSLASQHNSRVRKNPTRQGWNSIHAYLHIVGIAMTAGPASGQTNITPNLTGSPPPIGRGIHHLTNRWRVGP
jgi:hypothetical protein